MSIAERLPDLSDLELERLHANAIRLAQSGGAIQQRQAEDLLPLLGVVLEERRQVQTALLAEKRKADGRRDAVVSRRREKDRAKA